MRILHILSQLPESTGSGLYLQSLVREAASCGHRQHVLVAANRDQTVELPWISAQDTSVVRFDSRELPFLLPGMSDVMPYPTSRFSELSDDKLERYLSVFEAAMRWARRAADPEVVHTNHLWLVTALARKVFADRPLLCSSHGTELRQLMLCPQHAPLVMDRVRRVDRVLALTQHHARQLVDAFGLDEARVVVTGGAINTHLFGPAQSTRTNEFCAVAASSNPVLPSPLPTSGLRMAYVGKLSRAKGLASLLDAVELLRQQPLNFSLLIIGSGSGPEAEALKARARAMGPPVFLLGPMRQPMVADLLRGCHVFVLPSFFEGLPLSVLEALVSGCRVVLTDLPTIHHWPEPGLVSEGIIERVALPRMQSVDEPDPSELPAFARRLAEALALQLRRSVSQPLDVGLLKLSAAFGWDTLFRRIERLYQQLITGEVR